MLMCSESFGHRLRGLLALVLSLLLSEGCAGPKYWPASEGRVLDAETGEPLAGVFVISRHWGDIPVPGYSSSSCYHVAGTTTSEDGNYRIPSSVDVLDIKVDKRSRLDLFKPGYRHVFYKDGIAKLEKDTGTREDRLEYISESLLTCYPAGKNNKNLLPLYEALYDEANSIASSKEDMDIVNWLLRNVEEIKNGFEEAEKRHFDRMGINK